MVEHQKNIRVENQVLPILKIRPPYITLLQKTKSIEIYETKFLSDQYSHHD